MPGLLPVTTEGSRLGVMLSGLDLIHFRFQRGNQVAQCNIVRSAAIGSRLVVQDRESGKSRLKGS
jgi:hypothetical protein